MSLTGRHDLSPLERFEAQYLPDPVSGCWLWIGAVTGSGYASIMVNATRVQAHRWSYEYHVAPIPDGLELDHLCRVPRCVNPDHLEPVTKGENIRRGTAADHGIIGQRRRSTQCKRGHSYTPENTRLRPKGRECIECARRLARMRYYRRKGTSDSGTV